MQHPYQNHAAPKKRHLLNNAFAVDDIVSEIKTVLPEQYLV